jgi:uncharacterized membrane protein YesL
MGGIFSMDGILYKFGTLVFDMFFLNLLWFVCCIPIVTAGASTTALFYVCGKKVRGEEGYIFRDFFKSFKMNFKQSTIVWLFALLAIFVLSVDFKAVSLLGGMSRYFAVLLLVICFELVITLLYIFPVLSKFYIKTSSLIKTAFFMANKHILTTILCILVAIAISFILYKFSFFMFFMFSAYAYLTSFLFDRVFSKYAPEEEDEEEENFRVRD